MTPLHRPGQLFHFRAGRARTPHAPGAADMTAVRKPFPRCTSHELSTTILPPRNQTEFFICFKGSLYEPTGYGRHCTIECTVLR